MVGFYLLLATALTMILCIPMNVAHALGAQGETKILCIESERQALLKFTQGLGDASNRFSSWATGIDCCKWKGVKCSTSTGHVISLDLVSRFGDDYCVLGELQGEINSALLELPYLTYLDLSCNIFTQSQLPPFLGSLNNLQYLNLSSCNLKGTIPDDFRNLSRLKSLDLRDNFLRSNNLEWLYHLSSLKVLDLSGVDLSNTADGWIHALNLLPSLAELHLRGCRLNYVPPSLPQVNYDFLLTLDLSYNDFNTSSILDWLFQCCHNLRYLDLSSNELEGEIPTLTDLSNKPSLREMHLSNNSLNGTLKTSFIQQLSQLIVLDVSQNDLEGAITDVHLENLNSIQVLDLSENHFLFNISRDWVPPFQLETIILSHCYLGPQFPKWIQTQKNFSYIDISHANISDVVPDWFWNLSLSVEYVDLSYNDLRGCVPNLSSKMKLEALDLSNNNFACRLPNLPQHLWELNLARNSLFGHIMDVCNMNLSSLLFLDLSSNEFSGDLPNCWTNATNLLVLRLADNHFVGSLPDTLGALSNLVILSMNNNNFSGNPPSSIKNCTSLIVFDVGNNKLSGTIPSWIDDMKSLSAVVLSSNAFEGNIPNTLCNVKYLHILDFSFNQLSGAIPHCIFAAMATELSNLMHIVIEFSNELTINIDYNDGLLLTWKGRILTTFGSRAFSLVRTLDLSSNFLTGDIPEEITGYVLLKSLNLSRNQLEGVIPSNIGNMESLEVLDLSWNKLTGVIPTSIIDMDQLSILDVSHNNLTGQIPLGRHLDTFDALSFMDNPNLCGHPLNRSCTANDSFQEPYDREKGGERDGFEISPIYISVVIGFVTGFWTIWGPLLLSRSWRQAYFRSLGHIYDKIYVMVAITMTELKRKFQD